jgi:hypothetical protein
MITSAIQQATDQTKTSFEQYLLSKQMAEKYEWKQRRMEWDFLEQQRREEREEDRMMRWEEELHEIKLKESRQQQQMNNFLQFAMTGMMAFMGVKLSINTTIFSYKTVMPGAWSIYSASNN